MRRKLARLMILILAGCGESSGPPGPAASLRLSADSVILFVDSTILVRAEARDAGGQLVERPVAWHLFDSTRAVLHVPLLTGLRTGTTSLVAAVDSISTRIPVRVVVRFKTAAIGSWGTTCALTIDGIPYCWGTHAPTPRPVATNLHFTDVVVGYTHVCARTVSGDVWCWRPDPAGIEVPFQVSNGPFMQFVIGLRYACGLTPAGLAVCWHTTNQGAPQFASPFFPAPSLAFRSLAGDGTAACGITTSHETWCWGENEFGQLATHSTYSTDTPTRIGIPAADTVVTGWWHVCALTSGHQVWCWGYNYQGQAGDTATGSGCYHYGTRGVCTETPQLIQGGHAFTRISASGFSNCGLEADGSAWCWGDNSMGNYGISAASSSTPVPSAGGMKFAVLYGQRDTRCGLSVEQRLYCWGYNGGQNLLGLNDGSFLHFSPALMLNQP